MNTDDKDKFLAYVQAMLCTHPDMLPRVISAATAGVQDSVDRLKASNAMWQATACMFYADPRLRRSKEKAALKKAIADDIEEHRACWTLNWPHIIEELRGGK